MLNQHEINLKQYQNKSLSYLNSTAHSEGVEFDKFIKEIDEYSNAVVLDLGCGGGHVAYNVARHADLVFAYDLSHEMLDTVSKAANARKIKNIFVQQGALLHKDLKVKTSHIYSNLSDNSGMWSA